MRRIMSIVLVLMLVASLGYAQEQKKGDMTKIYTQLSGEYEFDVQGNVQVIKFFVKEGSLYITQEGSSREPGKLQPVEGKNLEFTFNHPERGLYRITFTKGEKEKVYTCTVLLEDYGFDFSGPQLIKTPENKYAEILGEWEFDIEGYGALTFKFYTENDKLLIVPVRGRDDESSEVKAVEGKELEYTVDTPNGNRFSFTFIKDEAGKITKCKIVEEINAMEAMGVKKVK